MNDRAETPLTSHVVGFSRSNNPEGRAPMDEVQPPKQQHACRIGRVCFFGYLLVSFALLDICLFLLGIADLTGVIWGPLLSAMLGAILIGLDRA